MSMVEEARKLMQRQTKKNQAPAWALTKLAIKKGKELARKYKVDREIVLLALYLAHLVFSKIPRGKIQRTHEILSLKPAQQFLEKNHYPQDKQKMVLNAIAAHHGKVPFRSREAEIMVNAECFKFVTVKGCLIYLHELGQRGYDYQKSVELVFYKINQKRKLLTLPGCQKEAAGNIKKIEDIFKSNP